MSNDIEELKRRRALGRQMGGADSIAFQHSRGKMTVRERVDALADEDSFDEIGVLAGTPEWDGNALKDLTPSNIIIGKIRIDGRKVFVNGGDFTIRGGSADGGVAGKTQYGERYAFESRLPYVRLIDASGGSVRTFEKIGMTAGASRAGWKCCKRFPWPPPCWALSRACRRCMRRCVISTS